MKRRILCLMASLLLCGVVSAQNHWGDDPDSHAQPSNTPIVASVGTLDGAAVTITDNCRLGAFVGNELRGIAAPTDGKFWIQVFYTATTDNITFKFYNGTTEYATCATILTGSDAGYGTPGAPVVLNFTNGVEQTMALAEGANWYSFNVDITLDELKSAIIAALPNSAITIKSKDGQTSYNPNNHRWNGSILWDITNMYVINVPVSCEISLEGMPIDPTEHPITIREGANWIGFPLTQSMTLTNAFANFAVDGDMIKSKSGTAQYNRGRWQGSTLTELEPGKGYKYISYESGDRPLVFQTTSSKASK